MIFVERSIFLMIFVERRCCVMTFKVGYNFLQDTLSRTMLIISRSSHWRCAIKKGVVKNFAKFTGKHQCQSVFFSKVWDLRPITILKEGPWHRLFSLNFAKCFRTLFLQNHSRRLLLDFWISFAFFSLYFWKISGIYSNISFTNFELFLSIWYSL